MDQRIAAPTGSLFPNERKPPQGSPAAALSVVLGYQVLIGAV